ncbi:MAG: hypothetical protein ACE5JD_17275, partial [Candidatus Methylomirabilia bacterium]
RELNQSLIQDIITDKAMSGLRVLSLSYSHAEKKNLTAKRYLLHIGNQILLAAYSALEMYLISKIKEYAQYRLKGDKGATVTSHKDDPGVSHKHDPGSPGAS